MEARDYVDRELPVDLPGALASIGAGDIDRARKALSSSSDARRQAVKLASVLDLQADQLLVRDSDFGESFVTALRSAARHPIDPLRVAEFASEISPLRTVALAVGLDDTQAFADASRLADVLGPTIAEAVEAAWARRLVESDLSELAHRLGDGERPGLAYLSVTACWAWRLATIGWAVSSASDPPAEQRRLAVQTLSSQATAESAAAIEPFTDATQRFIDDPLQSLSEADESFIRAELEIIRSQHKVVEGADATYVTRAIGRIVERMILAQAIGTQARSILLELGAEPPEVVDEIAGQIAEFTRVVAEQWAAALDSPALSPADAAVSIDNAATAATKVEETAEKSGLRAKLLDSMLEGAGRELGSRVVRFAGALAIASASAAGGDAAIYWLIEAMPKLFELYTMVVSAPEDSASGN